VRKTAALGQVKRWLEVEVHRPSFKRISRHGAARHLPAVRLPIRWTLWTSFRFEAARQPADQALRVAHLETSASDGRSVSSCFTSLHRLRWRCVDDVDASAVSRFRALRPGPFAFIKLLERERLLRREHESGRERHRYASPRSLAIASGQAEEPARYQRHSRRRYYCDVTAGTDKSHTFKHPVPSHLNRYGPIGLTKLRANGLICHLRQSRCGAPLQSDHRRF